MLSLPLVSAGYRVYGAANGWEALEQMEKHSIDVILTDSHMPEMVERGAFAWIRKGSEFTVLIEVLDDAIQQSVHA